MSDNDKSFSERMGLVPPKAMQTDNLDKETRAVLYNIIDKYFSIDKNYYDEPKYMFVWRGIGKDFLRLKIDDIFIKTKRKRNKKESEINRLFYFDEKPMYPKILHSVSLSDEMKKKYKNSFDGEWYRILDLIEFLYLVMSEALKECIENFSRDINNALKQENVGYSFSDGKFIPVPENEEMKEIKRAADSHHHAGKNIKKAMNLFADRQNPDYANSIKESISAVESLAKKITGENNFDKAINKLKENGVKLHPQFEKAIKNMYQFTSDDDGIRHGGIGEPLQCDQATARYMLIVCSAIVNFITDKAADKKP